MTEVRKQRKTNEKMTLGAFIRSLRLQNGMTQAKLADKVGITDKAVSKWERDVSYPDVALFPKLADVLGVSVCDLLDLCIEEGQPSRLMQIFKMTHDIRTPLHTIIGYANLAELHQDDPARLSRYLDSIRISGDYLMKTLDRLMEVANQEQPEYSMQVIQQKRDSLGTYVNEKARGWKAILQNYVFAGRRILIAEDIRLNRELVSEMLQQTGAEVEFAEDGQVCLELVENAPAGYFDLILMDIRMPNMDGLEATRRIRQLPDPKKAAIPIIALSANVYEEERKASYDAGMNAFAEKPIILEKLFGMMKDCLQIA